MKLPRTNQSYEVLEYAARIVLLDIEGLEAHYTRQETVRFLKATSTIVEYGWGNGIAFASHEIDAGRITRRKLIGSRLQSVVQLTERRLPGEELTFAVDRIIKNGFISPSEWWLEVEVYHPTRRICLEVVLPPGRAVRSARFVHFTTDGDKVKRRLRINRLPDRSHELATSVSGPRTGSRFRITWDW